MKKMAAEVFIAFAAAAAAAALICSSPAKGHNVTYDGRSIIIDGNNRILFSGSIHYTRSTPMMWPSLIAKANEGGLDCIQTYVFWNVHEPMQGQFNFEGQHDLVGFIKEIAAHGLYVSLRIGPFIEAEWKYGGLPLWLHDIPGIVFRTDNEPFKFHMKNFVTKIVNMMKSEGLYASQGGPIIISQIENEYSTIEQAFGAEGPLYMSWAASMAVSLETGVPWMMCKQTDAPDPVINTCNGMKCGETFTGPNKPYKPALWTENWTSFFQVFGGEPYIRSVEDIAFQVAFFIANKEGSFINYYMYHGGTNLGRFGSQFVTTSYYDQAPLDEYGLIRQPLYDHLKSLHTVIKQEANTLLFGERSNFSLGPFQEAFVSKVDSTKCVAFLVNYDSEAVDVQFQNMSYSLRSRSITILSCCKDVVFNTANVTSQYNQRLEIPVPSFNRAAGWFAFYDGVPKTCDTQFTSDKLVEQISTTKDSTDYLWYITDYEHNSSEKNVVLQVNSLAHVLHVFINGELKGRSHGSHDHPNVSIQVPIFLNQGSNSIALLSAMVGLPDSGAYLEHKIAGINEVTIQRWCNLSKDLSNNTWGYQVGLLGERILLHDDEGRQKVKWVEVSNSTQTPLTWYMTWFDAPSGSAPVALDLRSMGKGQTWVNGEHIGRYWVSFLAPNNQPSQTLYHVPRSFLKPFGNLLVIFEEEGGDPFQISLVTISRT